MHYFGAVLYALSYDFEIFKRMSHNLELHVLSFQKMWFVGVDKKNESAIVIRM